MIEVSFRLKCNDCGQYFLTEPWVDDGEGRVDGAVRNLLLAAELGGWKVNRLAKDVYYGQAWCLQCRPDRCEGCNGRGYRPNFKNWNSYYGEPGKDVCLDCNGARWVPRPSLGN